MRANRRLFAVAGGCERRAGSLKLLSRLRYALFALPLSRKVFSIGDAEPRLMQATLGVHNQPARVKNRQAALQGTLSVIWNCPTPDPIRGAAVRVFSWWYFLCAVGALNVTAWGLSVAMLKRRRHEMSEFSYVVCRRQVILAAVYVFGCAFRSALPVFDVPRLCLFDTWLSSVVVGRSIATIAELCFVAQWALLLRGVAGTTGSVFLKSVSHLLVPLILVAEMCSWYSVLTTANLGHVIEETLWGISASLVVMSLAAFQPRCPPKWRPAVTLAVLIGSAYAAYMFLVDVPMYWARWVADEAAGRHYLTLAQGLSDAFERRVVSHRWDDWKTEVVWMSLYFSVAVWISISLIHASSRRWLRADRTARVVNPREH